MVGTTSDSEDELRGSLKPFFDRLGHKSRRRMCPLYVAGLIGPGDRKNVQPMAERLAPGDYNQLHHFVAAGVWDAAPLETKWHSSGSARWWQRRRVRHRRYGDAEEGRALGRRRCAVRFSAQQDRQLPDSGVTDARPRRSPVIVALRLFLPDSPFNDRRRLKRLMFRPNIELHGQSPRSHWRRLIA